MHLLTFLLLGCPGPSTETGKDTNPPDAIDEDGDGYTGDEGDCDDNDADVNPGEEETPYNEVDDDCDASTPDDDLDGDTYAEADDCNDLDAAVHPGATEVCDGVDDDCDGTIDLGATDGSVAYVDADGDGYGDGTSTTTYCDTLPDGYAAEAGDCDDTQASVHPGAPEICDDYDNDCDGAINEDQPDEVTYFRDADGDGHGTPDDSVLSCATPEGYVADGDDCDDTDASVHPGADELCDGIDQDCDSAIDDNPIDGGTWYTDADLDGYGDDATAVSACEQPADTVAIGGDCDDTAAAANPGGVESCDGLDNDCNGTVDDGFATSPWYADTDADGYGDAAGLVEACMAPEGYVEDATDCDDTRSDVNPGADEVCDGVDDNCDGAIDEGGLAVTWYADTDGDGYGDLATATTSCASPGDGWVLDGTDCDDAAASTNPGATESCDGVDDDCDGDIDETGSVGAPTWYLDADGDTFGDPTVNVDACSAPAGYVANQSDCDDATGSINPDAAEVCNGIDDDCDGAFDNGFTTTAWYADTDGDGAGDPAAEAEACVQPAGYVADAGDCDDTTVDIGPSVAEVCDGVDNDCSGTADDGLPVLTWSPDADRDGYGDDSDLVTGCSGPDGYASEGGDCDDGSAATHPGADEQCDGLDNDCDGTVDNGIVYADYYVDGDGDGYGEDGGSLSSCVDMAGYSRTAGDCDDASAAVNPGATEVCDGVDDDCDGTTDGASAVDATTSWMDADGDGWGSTTSTTTCGVPSGYATSTGDCNDASAAAYPGAVETCDGLDNDCDGAADEAGATGEASSWKDGDGDGYGDASHSAFGCTAPSGYVDNSGDCDDSAAAVHLGATETCDGIDDDCDGNVDEAGSSGETTWYADADHDGYGSTTSTTASCSMPSGYVATGTDCNDGSSAISPAATETCNGVDDDCDGSADELGATGGTTYYLDADADGYGTSTSTLSACSLPSGYSTLSTDCNDGNAAISPAATESCDSVDDDCDGSVDESGSTGETTWYRDRDADGYGGTTTTYVSCNKPSGYSGYNTDCNDSSASVHPGATESCNSVDDDCDGSTDEAGSTGETTTYPDLDGDSYGDEDAGVTACTSPAGYIADGTDCDDDNIFIFPSAPELCDGVDTDCDGLIADETGKASLWDGAAWTDYTTRLTGTAAAPVKFGDSSKYSAIVTAGTLYLCPGTWYIRGVFSTSTTTASVVGRWGAAYTTIDAGSSESGSVVSVTNATIDVEGLTLTGGLGSSSGTLGGGVIANKTSAGLPTTPNLTLTDCVVTDNSTAYGGGVAVQGYGWVDLVDTIVESNTASVAGGGAWIQSTGEVSCTATSLGGGGFVSNSSPIGGGLYLSATTTGTLDSVGCDWGADGVDDNATYDVRIAPGTGGPGYCYGNASALTDTVTCSGGSCTASTDSTCP